MNTKKHDYLVIRQIASSIGVLLLAMLFLVPQTDIMAGSCGDLDSYEVPTLLSATATNDGVEMTWTPVTDERFLQYRILVSKTDATPEGDVNGYLIKNTNQQASGYTVDGSVAYNLGDFFAFEAGTKYYFAVAVEYDCGYITESIAFQATFPDLSPIDLIQPEFTSTWGDSGIVLLWDPIVHENLADIRVVASKIDPNPSYPDNGFVAILNTTANQYLIDNSSSYSVEDFDEFIPGQQYYVALTARYVVNDTDYYATSPAQRVTYEGPGSALTYITAPTVTVAKTTDAGLTLTWNKIDDYRLTEYAIMVAQNASPVYPSSGIVKVLDTTATSYTISNSDSFATTNFDYLQYGEKYTFAVTAVYGNEHRTSASYTHSYNGPLPSNTASFHELAISALGNNQYKASWNPVHDRRIASIYLVVSDSNTSPSYSDTSMFVQVQNDAGATVPGMQSFTFNANSFTQEGVVVPLVDGQEYHARLTFFLRDGTSFTSDANSFTYAQNVAAEDDDRGEAATESQSQEQRSETTQTQIQNTGANQSLLARLRGYVLLQVENNGEAWYVDPASDRRYYLKDPETAFTALRNFGLGIANADLVKIPIGVESRFGGDDSDGDGLIDKLEEGVGTDPHVADTDGDGYDDATEVRGAFNPLGAGSITIDTSLINRLRGRIVLQVEDRGQAWYVNPQDGKRYYMKDGQAAFDILRFLSLGISNGDLDDIPVAQ